MASAGPNLTRVIQAVAGAGIGWKMVSKFIPEGGSRTFLLGVGVGTLGTAALDDMGVDVIKPLRTLYGTAVNLGADSVKEIKGTIENQK